MTPSPQPAAALVAVHLLELPVPLAARAQAHFQGLLREFALIAGGSQGEQHHAPGRLLRLVDTLTAAYGSINSAADERLEDAIDNGDLVIGDHVLQIPPDAGPAATALADIIDEADMYCSKGEHVLTLVTPRECVAYRHWYLGQVLDQLDGHPPVAWPDSPEARDVAHPST